MLEGVQADHYLTSEGLINEDTIVSSEEGLKKTEYITVVFILLILFVVFRSFVAPFVPLLTVGLSYIVSQSVVSFLVDQFNFPISTFTQIFMVAVMFGIGTDYCILLISRFKEELTTSEDTKTAIIETYRKAGGTVIYSGLAVFVGFAAIGLSNSFCTNPRLRLPSASPLCSWPWLPSFRSSWRCWARSYSGRRAASWSIAKTSFGGGRFLLT